MLDIRTLALINIVAAVAFLTASVHLARLCPDRAGLRHWWRAAAAMIGCLILYGLRNRVPDALSVVLANVLLTLCMAWAWFGARALAGLPAGRRWDWIAAVVTGVVFAYFHYIQPDFWLRMAGQTLVIAPLLIVAGAVFWRFHEPDVRLPARITSGLLWLGAAIFVYRLFALDRDVTVDPMGFVQGPAQPILLAFLFANLFSAWLPIALTLIVSAQLQRSQRAALADAQAANLAKSAFLASMSHELRTPLNAILGFAELLRAETALPGRARRAAADIEQAGRHLLTQVDELIDLGRIESGQLPLAMTRVPLAPLLAECVQLSEASAHANGVRLTANLEVERLTVEADPLRLRLVLLNLLSNAIKYNRRGGSVRVHAFARTGVVRIAVVDDGPGIDRDKQARLFVPFDRLGVEMGTIQGTGVGLVISKRVIEAMRGRIGCDSDPGIGSTFWVELPLHHAPAQPGEGLELMPMEAPPTAAAPAPATVRRALLVEDNPINRKLMRAIIGKRTDWAIEEAESAEEGVVMAQAQPPDLILMDINLPGMDGYEALARLREDDRTRDVPVFAVTANAQRADVERGRAAGFNGYLTKPVQIPALMAVLDRVTQAPSA